MALILEDGSGVPNSNSYADVAFADAYFARHPFYGDTWAAIATVTEKENLLIFASAWIDNNFDWRGSKTLDGNSMRWPRVGARDRDLLPIANNVIPEQLREAVCEMACYLLRGDWEAATTSQAQGISELKIDVIELKFDGSIKIPAAPPAVPRLLRGLYDGGFGSRVAKVLVG